MKKIFALLLALLMLVSAIPFAAAAEADHEHYDNNGNGICDYAGCKVTVEATEPEETPEEKPEETPDEVPEHKHADNNGNGICDYAGCKEETTAHEHYDNNYNGVCDYPGCKETVDNNVIGPGAGDEDDDSGIAGHTHSYTGSYKYNSTYHWRQCWCGKTSTKVKHTFDRYGDCTKCKYSKNSWDCDNDGRYYVTLKETGKGDTRLSTRYADSGDYVYIYVDPDNGQKVDDIDVYATYGSKYSKYSKYDNYMDCDYFEYSRYYGSSKCTKHYTYNCDRCYSYSRDINVLKRGTTCYYFRMPASDVTVEVSYTGGSYKYDETYGSYNDVSSSDWFYSAVNYVTKYEIMPGESYTKFAPNVNMDRATVALALYNISGAKASGRESFSDVDSDDWFYDAVVWCSNKGIIEGWNGKFDPYGDVTREDFAVMMYRYANYKRYNTKASEELDFSDADKVSNYAVEALEWAVAEGLINGMGNGTVAPQGNTTRAQAAAVLMRFCKNVK